MAFINGKEILFSPVITGTSAGGTAIIHVEVLPTEKINSNAFYRTSEGIFWYDGEWHELSEKGISEGDYVIENGAIIFKSDAFPDNEIRIEEGFRKDGQHYLFLADENDNPIKLGGVFDPESDFDAANKRYVDNSTSGKQDKLSFDGAYDKDTNKVATVQTVTDKVAEVESIAKGATEAVAYANYEAMITVLNETTQDRFRVGQNILIHTLDVPDVWISEVSSVKIVYNYRDDDSFVRQLKQNGSLRIGYYRIAPLETFKVDLTEYAKKEAVDRKLDHLNGLGAYVETETGTDLIPVSVLPDTENTILGKNNIVQRDENGQILLLDPSIDSRCAVHKGYVDNAVKPIASKLDKLSGDGAYVQTSSGHLSLIPVNDTVNPIDADKRFIVRRDSEGRIAISDAEPLDNSAVSKKYVDNTVTNKVAEIVAGAPEDFDTLKEMSDWIASHKDSAAGMNSSIKANTDAIRDIQNAGYAKTSDVPSKVSQLENDTKYVNETQLNEAIASVGGGGSGFTVDTVACFDFAKSTARVEVQQDGILWGTDESEIELEKDGKIEFATPPFFAKVPIVPGDGVEFEPSTTSEGNPVVRINAEGGGSTIQIIRWEDSD